MDYSKIIDISISLDSNTTIYPANPRVVIEEFSNETGTSTYSKISMGTHTATHIDAPKHIYKDGKSLDEILLENFVGSCRVLDFSFEKESVTLESLKSKDIKDGDRILLKTNNSMRGYEEFYNDYIYLSGDGAEYLAEKDIKLIGIDYLSIKQRGSQDHRPHTAFLEKNIPILEGIQLKNVEEGEYFLVVLAPKFIGVDGSPARAILLE
ncbi:MAG: cyclase family protein [Candidatus Roizmanbacteria bacterium]